MHRPRNPQPDDYAAFGDGAFGDGAFGDGGDTEGSGLGCGLSFI